MSFTFGQVLRNGAKPSLIAGLIARVVISQTNESVWDKNRKKFVDASRSTPHNAPRNAVEGNAKKMAT